MTPMSILTGADNIFQSSNMEELVMQWLSPLEMDMLAPVQILVEVFNIFI